MQFLVIFSPALGFTRQSFLLLSDLVYLHTQDERHESHNPLGCTAAIVVCLGQGNPLLVNLQKKIILINNQCIYLQSSA